MLDQASLLEIGNTLACGVMLVYMLLISIVMPSRGMWANRTIIWVMTFALGFQIISPWAGWVPRIVWHGALLHISLALSLLIWNREAILFIRCKFSPPGDKPHPMNRATDWIRLSENETANVAGGLKETP